MKIAYFLIFVLFASPKEVKKTFSFCGKSYALRTENVILKEVDLTAKMTSIVDPKTKKFVLGYYQDTYKNDTLLISSKIKINNCNLIITEYFKNKIKGDIDSTRRHFESRKGKIVFNLYEEFFNGVITNSTKFNKELN